MASGELTWRELIQDDYRVDFIALTGRVTELSVGYAVCYLNSETEQTALKMMVGTAGRAKIYLNGKQIYEYRFSRGFTPDHDTIDDLTLHAGRNVLVLKVVINAGALVWRNSVRFTDARGDPVRGIRVALSAE